MWITGDVRLPDEILDAHEAGTLVFFVGAGASLGKPSNLPLFDGLARKLARLASYPFSKRGGLDFFIGQLESLPQGFDAHQHAKTLIANPKSSYNSLHSVIVDLANTGNAFRVVTTNYDDHLAGAASAASIAVPDTWYGPALPLGRDFAGLVHLHGSVRRPKEEMILTDRDFGRAYITDAWATRFLLQMFDRFTVVFIGYSHDDLMMRYLALGLPSSGLRSTSRRFAFTNDPSDSKWGYLGIQPIEYPVAGRDHGALVLALRAWSDRAQMGQTDHRARVHAIVAGSTTLPLPDRDYLRSRLRTKEGATDFVNATSSLSDEAKVDWLSWLEDLPEFHSLFSPPDVPEAVAILGAWFAKTFVGSMALNGAALQTLQRFGQSMTASLFRTVTWIANDLGKQDGAASERWQTLLATSIFGQSAPLKTDYLLPFLPNSRPPSMAVLRSASRPLLKLERPWFLDESARRLALPDAKVVWNSEEYALTQHVLLAVKASSPGDRSLGGVLESAIIEAYDLLDAYHGERHWDPLAYHRSAIEPHSQDELREPLDAIIDGLREYGVKALSVIPDLPDRWWELGQRLMQRLALHLLASDPARGADEKLSWMLDRTGLYADGLKHETYQVLATVGGASVELKQRVLQAVAAGTEYPDDLADRDRHIAYAKLNILAWLTQCDPAWTEAQAALESIQVENPDFKVREHPDFDSWMSTGAWGGTPPMDTEDFIRVLEQDPSAALKELLSFDYSERHFDQPDWSDAIALVQQIAERRPDLAMRLWDVIGERTDLGEQQADLLRAITQGLASADLRDMGLPAIDRLRTMVGDPKAAYALGRFLLDQIRQQVDLDDSPVLEAMRELARGLWHEQGEGFSHGEDSTPLSFAPLYLNSWPGFVAQYWGGEVDRRWRHARDEWTGLNEEESTALVGLLSGNTHALDATQPAIAGELFFYFAADAAFAQAHILPVFTDARRSVFGWSPYLHHARWNDHLLAAGLFDGMVTEVGRLDALSDENLRYVFLGLVASVVSYAGISGADRRRLLDQTVLASEGSHAAGFAEAVAQAVREDGVDGAYVWRHWLGKHLEQRLRGQPRLASPEELARWADVVPAVGNFVPVAASLLSGHNIGLGERFFNREFPDGVLATYGAELVAFLAERVRNTENSDYMMSYRVKELVQTVRDATGDAVARPLIDAATEKGFLDAPS